jgi:hypothetical protein
MSNTAYLSIVMAFTTAMMLCATFYRPEYGEFFYRLKQEQPKYPRGCWKYDSKTMLCD